MLLMIFTTLHNILPEMITAEEKKSDIAILGKATDYFYIINQFITFVYIIKCFDINLHGTRGLINDVPTKPSSIR